MGFIVSTPSYVYQSPSGYIFRLRIPKDLKQLVGKVEFRYSLRSGSLRIAKYRSRCIAVNQLSILTAPVRVKYRTLYRLYTADRHEQRINFSV